MQRSRFSKLQSVPAIIGLGCLLPFVREQECLLALLLMLPVIPKGPSRCWPQAGRRFEVHCVHSFSFSSGVQKSAGSLPALLSVKVFSASPETQQQGPCETCPPPSRAL